MRAEQNKKKKRKKCIIWILVSILILIFIVFFNLFKSNTINISERSTENNSKSKDNSSTVYSDKLNENANAEIDELNLSKEQINNWVRSIINAAYPDLEEGTAPGNFNLSEIKIDPANNFATLYVGRAQTDQIGSFRVNQGGKLEAVGAIVEDVQNWQVVSNSYLDTDTIIKFQKEKKEKDRYDKNEDYNNLLLPVKIHLMAGIVDSRALIYEGKTLEDRGFIINYAIEGDCVLLQVTSGVGRFHPIYKLSYNSESVTPIDGVVGGEKPGDFTMITDIETSSILKEVLYEGYLKNKDAYDKSVNNVNESVEIQNYYEIQIQKALE